MFRKIINANQQCILTHNAINLFNILNKCFKVFEFFFTLILISEFFKILYELLFLSNKCVFIDIRCTYMYLCGYLLIHVHSNLFYIFDLLLNLFL